MTTLTQPNPSLEPVLSVLSDAQRRMLLQVAFNQPIDQRNGAVRTGLVERGLVEVIAPPTNWVIKLTDLGRTIADLLPGFLATRLDTPAVGHGINCDDFLVLLADGEPSVRGLPVPKWKPLTEWGLITKGEGGIGTSFTNEITPQGQAVADAIKALRASVPGGEVVGTADTASIEDAPEVSVTPESIARTLTKDQKELLVVAMLSLKGLTHPDKCHPNSLSRAHTPTLAKLGLVRLTPANTYAITPLGGQVYGVMDLSGEGEVAAPEVVASADAVPTADVKPAEPTAPVIADIDLKALIDSTIAHSQPLYAEEVGAYTIGYFTDDGAEYAFTDTEQDAIDLANELSDVWAIARDGVYISDSSVKGWRLNDNAPIPDEDIDLDDNDDAAGDDDIDPEDLARELGPTQRDLLETLAREMTLPITGSAAETTLTLKNLAFPDLPSGVILITRLGELVADAMNFLQITGEYDDEIAPPSTSVVKQDDETEAEDADVTDGELVAPIDGDTADGELVAPIDGDTADGAALDVIEARASEVTQLDDKDALIAQLRKEIALLTGALDDDNQKRLKDMRVDSAKTLVGKQLAALSKDHSTIIRHNRELTARAERAEAKLQDALKQAKLPAGGEAHALKTSLDQLQMQLDRQSFLHKQQIAEAADTIKKLTDQCDVATRRAQRAESDLAKLQDTAAQWQREHAEMQMLLQTTQTPSSIEYRVAQSVDADLLLSMESAGWERVHMQFENGVLCAVFRHPGKVQQPTIQPPLTASVTDTQEAKVVVEEIPDAPVFVFEPPVVAVPVPQNGARTHVVIVESEDAPDYSAGDDSQDPDGVQAMRQAMRAGVPASQITAQLNERNLAQAREGFATRQQQAADFAKNNPPFTRSGPPPRRLLPTTN